MTLDQVLFYIASTVAVFATLMSMRTLDTSQRRPCLDYLVFQDIGGRARSRWSDRT